MALREILVSLGIDLPPEETDKLDKALGMAKKAAAGIGLAFSAHKLKDWVEETVHEVARVAAETGHMAERLGVDAETLQVFGKIAKRAGVSSEEMGASLRLLSRNAYEASKGGKEAHESFSAVGVSVTGANGKLKAAPELLVEMADKFAGMKDPMEQVALAQKVFGRSGTAMLPILKKGGAALEAQIKHFEELGVTTEKQIEIAHEFESAQFDQEDAVSSLKKAFAFELMPVFTKMAKRSTELIRTFKPLAKMIGEQLARAIEVFSAVIRGPGGIVIALEALGAAAVAAGLKATLAFAGLIATGLLLAIIAAAVYLLIEDFIGMGEGADSVSGTMLQGVNELIDRLGVVRATIEMINTALDYWSKKFTGHGFMESTQEAMKAAQVNLAPGETVTPIGDEGRSWLQRALEPILGKPVQAYQAVGAPAMIAAPSSTVEVHVDASGATASPQEIGKAVADPVAAHQERQNRQLMQAFAVGQ